MSTQSHTLSPPQLPTQLSLNALSSCLPQQRSQLYYNNEPIDQDPVQLGGDICNCDLKHDSNQNAQIFDTIDDKLARYVDDDDDDEVSDEYSDILTPDELARLLDEDGLSDEYNDILDPKLISARFADEFFARNDLKPCELTDDHRLFDVWNGKTRKWHGIWIKDTGVEMDSDDYQIIKMHGEYYSFGIVPPSDCDGLLTIFVTDDSFDKIVNEIKGYVGSDMARIDVIMECLSFVIE